MTPTSSRHGSPGPVLLTIFLTVLGGLALLAAAWVGLPYVLSHPVLLVLLAVAAIAIFAGVTVWLFKTD